MAVIAQSNDLQKSPPLKMMMRNKDPEPSMEFLLV